MEHVRCTPRWILGIAAALLVAGCGDSGDSDSDSSGGAGGTLTAGNGAGANGNNGGGGSTAQFGMGGSGGGETPCENLECQQVDCEGDVTTTISGTVYEPAGTTPLYNVVVYVPNKPLDPITDGATCETCASTLSGDPVVSTLTDTAGHFVLEDVPAGDNIPLVIQIGKWRREITISSVPECTDTPLTDVEQTSLPSNQTEGHIPKIALTTGGADPLECLLRKIGIEDSEFTPEQGTGRVNLFAGSDGSQRYSNALNNGEDFTQAQTFWTQGVFLNSYDIVLLACEGAQNGGTKPQNARQAVQDYTYAGGRLFASHWHNIWFEQGPADFQSVAEWDFNQGDPPDPFQTFIDTTFPKGQALSQWLFNVDASEVEGELYINEPRNTVGSIDTDVAQQWIYGENPEAIEYFTFNTPVAAAEEDQCGRVVFSDLHVSSGDVVGEDFPEGCVTSGLSPQEKALLFMLFDLSSCIQPDDDPPCPPNETECGDADDPPCNGSCVEGCCQAIPT
ncbi:MAG: carboxypeptidase regulatory-like domain-containing protein [Polyangiaceae bacterium]|nr:carboxypeptidase regulatory-like domain-containing protein [Polyangiaceae bacterium]